MICNATLNTFTPPGAPSRFGDPAAGSPVAASVRCNLQQLTTKQRVALGDVAKDVTAVLYLGKSSLPATIAPVKDATVNVTLDLGTAVDFVIEQLGDQNKAGGLSHFELFVRRAS